MWRKMRKNPVVSSLAATVALLVCVATALSFAYAVHYRSLNTRVEQNALIAKQQRDSALSTLVELVFELQRKFDSDDIFIDEIQQSSLEIAMRGLEKVEGIAGTSNEGGLAMAVALRRLGQTLYNLDRIDESSRCLQKSEQLLRQLVARQPLHQPILMALADTVIAYDECLDEEDDMAQLARFEFAVTRCQTIASDHSPEFHEKLAKLLSSQAKCQMQNHLVEKALESLREAERILPSPSVSDASQPRSQPRSQLITTLQVQTLYACAYRLHDDMPAARTHAAKALSQIQQAGQSLEEDSSVIQVQLCCLELLGCLAKKAEPNVEPAWQTMYTELRERMLKLAETDGQDFAVVSEIVMQLVSDRVNEGMPSAAMDLLTLRIDLAEARLALLPEDRDALPVLLDCHVAAADIEIERDSRKSLRRAVEHCFLAFTCFERLNEAGHLSQDDWASMSEAIEYLIDGCDALPEDHPHWTLAEEWARKILQWSNDSKQALAADKEDLQALQEMCEEILGDGQNRR